MYQQFEPITPEQKQEMEKWGIHFRLINGKQEGYTIGHTGISNRPIVKTLDGKEWERDLFSSTYYETPASKVHFTK